MFKNKIVFGSFQNQKKQYTLACIIVLSLQSNESFIPEDDGTNEKLKLANDWPYAGNIIFENVWLRYNKDANPALKGVNATIRTGTKAIVVGRTGAGKSSLLSAIIRLVKLERGKIIIDGYDISKIKASDLRSAISVIPQEPILLRGNYSFIKKVPLVSYNNYHLQISLLTPNYFISIFRNPTI